MEVHDGDTVVLDLDLGFGFRIPGKSWGGKTELSCRVYGINAPELATEAGKAATTFARSMLLPGSLVTVLSHGWDKYGGRFDGSITLADGRDFGNAMIAAGFAVPYLP